MLLNVLNVYSCIRSKNFSHNLVYPAQQVYFDYVTFLLTDYKPWYQQFNMMKKVKKNIVLNICSHMNASCIFFDANNNIGYFNVHLSFEVQQKL